MAVGVSVFYSFRLYKWMPRSRVGFNYAVCAPRHKFYYAGIMLDVLAHYTYYAKNYASIIDAGLLMTNFYINCG